jgi:hypothetical protein
LALAEPYTPAAAIFVYKFDPCLFERLLYNRESCSPWCSLTRFYLSDCHDPNARLTR